ncbi:unnamed protein product [Mytilus edulis]|uniref:Mutator-like transposase domain-containing protein n=1 Tax=Mytilus edulis TaxID=6550 RepID=A0A8S3SF12_MYTED|nr:unnamed protein product [Mytilus edulis]
MFTKGHTKKWSKKDNSPRNPGCFQAGKPSGRSRSQTSIQIPESASASTSYVRQTFKSSDCKMETTGNICTLRPQANADLKREENKELHSGMRWIDSQLTLSLFNTTNDKHQVDSPSCPKFNADYYEQKKWGTCWQFTLKCIACGFIGDRMKMYKEIANGKPGPNPGQPNVALASALQDCPIGNTTVQQLLAGMDTPPPCRSSMQRTSSRVAAEMVKLNKTDMAQKLELVKEVNRRRGVPENEINITVDARYNSNTIVSKKKPGQNATQVFALGIETITDRKFIVAAVVQNKMCWKGAWLRGKGFPIECPGHEECTANLYRAAALSEYELGKEMGNQIGLQKCLVRYVTTDGDGRSAKGIEEALTAVEPMWKVERLADHVHLGQSQFRASLRAQYSPGMFHGKTKEENKQLKTVFSKDLKCRCSMILKKLMEKYDKNINEISKDLPKVLDATLRCYDGDCTQCHEYSIVCKGDDALNWWSRSHYLSTYQITALQMDKTDKFLLQEILKMKLTTAAIESMKLYDNTNKNEGVHRALSVNLPKNVIYSKNMEGRLASGVHRNNNMPGTSTQLKCTNLGVELSERSKRYLKKMDTDFKYNQDYILRPEVQKRRLQQNAEKLAEHKTWREMNKKHDYYCKGQLDPQPALQFQDHDSYCKPKLPRPAAD